MADATTRRAPKTWRGWTTLELRRLERLRMDGLTVARCAAALGRTFDSVKCALRGLDATPPRRVLRYADALALPGTNADLVRRLGLSASRVKQLKRELRRLGFPVGGPCGGRRRE